MLSFSTFFSSLHCKCNLTFVSTGWKAAVISLSWAWMDLINYRKFVSNFLSWKGFQQANQGMYLKIRVNKWGWCFADGLNQSLICKEKCNNFISQFNQQLIQSVGENANLGYSLEDIIKWYVSWSVDILYLDNSHEQRRDMIYDSTAQSLTTAWILISGFFFFL